MYNRYVPQSTSYTWVGADRNKETGGNQSQTVSRSAEQGNRQRPVRFKASDHGEERSYINAIRSGIQTIWKSNAFDSGDLLLLLILLLLWKEGEDPELIVVLGAVLLFGVGESRDDGEERETGDG